LGVDGKERRDGQSKGQKMGVRNSQTKGERKRLPSVGREGDSTNNYLRYFSCPYASVSLE
jgi:hypothetical protein